MKRKRVVSKCCEVNVQLIPKGLLGGKDTFLCPKCNKVCEIKIEDEKIIT